MSDDQKPAPLITIPPYEVQMPLCPLCLDETGHDGDSISCDSCGVYWPSGGASGVRIYEDDPMCTAESKPFADKPDFASIAHITYRCVLGADHTSQHAGVRSDVAGSEDTRRWAVARVAETVRNAAGATS